MRDGVLPFREVAVGIVAVWGRGGREREAEVGFAEVVYDDLGTGVGGCEVGEQFAGFAELVETSGAGVDAEVKGEVLRAEPLEGGEDRRLEHGSGWFVLEEEAVAFYQGGLGREGLEALDREVVELGYEVGAGGDRGPRDYAEEKLAIWGFVAFARDWLAVSDAGEEGDFLESIVPFFGFARLKSVCRYSLGNTVYFYEDEAFQ